MPLVGEIMKIRVVTLNVWNTEGDQRRPDLINREMKRLAPDLVAFQEVVQSSDIDMLHRLLQGMDMHVSHQADVLNYVPAYANRFGGTALATRWPHRIVEALDLRIAGADNVPWATLAAIVALPQLGDMLFIAATAAWRLADEAVREQKALAITDLDARHRCDLPTVIAGDFNAVPDAASIRFLTGRQSLNGRSVLYHDAWSVAGKGHGHTWTVDNPHASIGAEQIVRQPNHRSRFDYVFVGSWDAHPKAHAKVQDARLAFDRPIDDVWLSDHFGLLVDLEVGISPS